MLGAYNILPFLKGWQYKKYQTRVIELNKGATPIEGFRADEEGLLLWAEVSTDDCYAKSSLEFSDAKLEVKIIEYAAEDLATAGKWNPDPRGYISRYYRPAQASTMGIYYFTMFNGYFGVSLPFYRSFVINNRLTSSSTEESAKIQTTCDVAVFIDKKKFIESYRQFMAIKDLKIEKEILEVTA